MHQQSYEPGDIIFREGEAAGHAFVVLAGEVELRWPRRIARAPLRLGRGEVFGQVDVITGQPRQQTAFAAGALTAALISRDDFLGALNARLDIVEPFLRRLFGTLMEVEAASAPAPARAEPAAAPRRAESEAAPQAESEAPRTVLPHSLLLRAEDPRVAAQLGNGGLSITALPFRVGRKPVKGESLPPGGLELVLEDEKPFNLSRRHFAIEAGRDGVLVRDAGSHLGTIVNGLRVGGQETMRVAPLSAGENLLIAGSDTSPFVFRLRVEAG